MAAPLILACDTTQGACSVALYAQTLIGEKLSLMGKGHAEALIPMMQDLLHETGYAMSDIERLAVTNGPGTFTGTRVGLAAMRGLAVALKKPLKAYGTLHVMAQGAQGAQGTAQGAKAAQRTANDSPLLVAVDARRGVFYAQCFDGQRKPDCEAQALSADAALALMGDAPFSIIGSGAAELLETATRQGLICHQADGDAYPRAAHVAALAAVDEAWDNPALPRPFYLRPPDATLPDRAKFPARAAPETTAASAADEDIKGA